MDTIDKADPFAVTSLEQLDEIYGDPLDAAIRKQTDFITPPGRAFIEASPFMILATVSGEGVDCSPKGDGPGFVQILDDRTLLIPDRPGNNRVDGMKNIIANPKVGTIFFVPGSNTTYRVNGTARITTDPVLFDRFLVNGKPPRAVVVVSVEEAFSHCPKAFVRGKFWEAGAEGRGKPTFTNGTFAAYRDGGDEAYAAKYDQDYDARLKDRLY
jgi:PPOX class probable FMN-dependent enzyme